MPAKKNIIKELRQEIKALNDKLAGEQQHLLYRERQFKRIAKTHENELAMINIWTNNLANTLKYKFAKDLSWLALTDDSESKMRHIKEGIAMLYNIAAPPEEDDD